MHNSVDTDESKIWYSLERLKYIFILDNKKLKILTTEKHDDTKILLDGLEFEYFYSGHEQTLL